MGMLGPMSVEGPDARREVLEAALRAPSAHNAQPWRLSRAGEDDYLLWYAFADKLLADPDDRDGLIALGGFYETLRLAAAHRGLRADFVPGISRHEAGITLGTVTFGEPEGEPDPLAAEISGRQCNRHRYDRTPLPPMLRDELLGLGNVVLAPHRVVPLVRRASILAWRDERFISDLRSWTRFDDTSPDGMTLDCLDLDRFDTAALRFAFRLGRLPGWLAAAYAQRDVRLTRASSAMAVLVAEDREPLTLFDCGRRLIRSWTLINSLGYAWHPMSIVIDQATVTDLAASIGGRDPVALYRVGATRLTAPWSHRRGLEAVLAPSPA
jgi:hypothetical protein